MERNSIVVRLEAIPAAVPDLAVARKRLEERLSLTGLLLELEIRMETVRRLATDERTLKFRRMISRVGTPEDMNLPLKGGL